MILFGNRGDGFIYVSPKTRGRLGAHATKNLDKVVSTKSLRFELRYPFQHALAVTVEGPVTLRKIIDTVRQGYRIMYSGVAKQRIKGLANMRVVSDTFGEGFHDIGDLVIEQIAVKGNRLHVGIGS